MSSSEYREWYLIGVYDPNHYDEWPYYFYDDGVYITKKGRIGLVARAQEFDSIEKANEFLEQWGYKKKDLFKYEYVRLEHGTKPVKPLYDPTHPLARIFEGKERSLYMMAYNWYHGRNPNKNYADLGYSKSTFYRQRKALLKYGVDIAKEPDVVFLTLKPREPKVIEVRMLTEQDLPDDLKKTILKPNLRLITSNDTSASEDEFE